MFYDNLKAVCEKQNLKITNVVIECGGAPGSINGWKKGSMPNSNIVIALAMRLNVSTDYLLLGKETSNASHISNSIVDHSKGIITISGETENKDKHNPLTETILSENEEELLRIFKSLPTKERVKLLSIIYDFEEQYHKSNT